MTKKFVHLHLHSEYSMLDGTTPIDAIVNRAANTGMDAVALTDHGVMYGAIQFVKACKEKNIKPIIGCEVYVAPNSRFDRDKEERKQTAHLILLAQNQTGYQNLSKLVTLAYQEGLYYKPRIDFELLSQNNDGLVCLSACLQGILNIPLLQNDFNQALEIAGKYRDIFGPDRFFIEIQDHKIDKQEQTNPYLIEIARTLNLGLVATNDCHFLGPNDRSTQDVMLCIQTKKKLSDTDRMESYSDHHYIKSPEEMFNIFSQYPDAIDNTVKISEMINFDPVLDAFHFPEFIPPDGSSPESYLKKISKDKLKKIMGGKIPDSYKERLNYELDVICNMGFASYFLIVADFVGWAKNQGIPVGPGRGSAAGSIVSYALGITTLDPIAYGLVFERFLNPARKSLPDIDIDFEPDGRAKVIEYVTNLYGHDHVCQIITFNRLQAKAAIRDVARVMDIPIPDADAMAKLMPFKMDLAEAIEKSTDFKAAYQASDLNKQWIDTALKVEGLTRNASIHAAGVIICKDPIWMHAPVQVVEGESNSVCMYSMNDAESAGLVKMDFLGLRTLTYIQQTCELIKQNHGIDIDINNIPLDDKKTFGLLASGDVFGIFQMEGAGMRELLMAIHPDRIEDIFATIALYRPGPMENDLHYKYVRRKHGREEITYHHHLLKPILEDTFGILTYQEQISFIIQSLGDIDLGKATLIMKLISKKKDRAAIAKYLTEFLDGCAKKGIREEVAQTIWDEMEAFAGYGFNKAHAAAYGIISYQTAWLKANYPVEFYAGYMSSEMDNVDKISLVIDEMKKKNIPILMPDINKSYASFTVENGGVRYGLAAIKGVGTAAVNSIVHTREETGLFTDLLDFTEKIDLRLVNKGVLEALVKSGACDSLADSRSALIQNLNEALEEGKRRQEDKEKGQTALFAVADNPIQKLTMNNSNEIPASELLRMEKEVLGFYLSHNPLEEVWEKIKSGGRERIGDLHNYKSGIRVRIVGMISNFLRRTSQRANPYLMFTVEDPTAKINGVVYYQGLERFGYLMESDAIVILKGQLRFNEKDGESQTGEQIREPEIVVDELWRYNPDATDESEMWISPSKTAPEQFHDSEIMLEPVFDEFQPVNDRYKEIQSLEIKVDFNKIEKSGIIRLGAHLSARKGRIPVKLQFLVDGRLIQVEAGENRRIQYSPELREAILEINGVLEVNTTTN